MACSNRPSTSSFGTKSPRFIISANCLPLSVPAVTSARNKSPVLKWLNLYFSTIFSHWVPLPLPGPPKIQMIGTGLGAWKRKKCEIQSNPCPCFSSNQADENAFFSTPLLEDVCSLMSVNLLLIVRHCACFLMSFAFDLHSTHSIVYNKLATIPVAVLWSLLAPLFFDDTKITGIFI